jgi:hypothetical protein
LWLEAKRPRHGRVSSIITRRNSALRSLLIRSTVIDAGFSITSAGHRTPCTK